MQQKKLKILLPNNLYILRSFKFRIINCFKLRNVYHTIYLIT